MEATRRTQAMDCCRCLFGLAALYIYGKNVYKILEYSNLNKFKCVMAVESLRREVLKSFKNIHRTRCYVFQGDNHALEKARQEINDAYKKNKGETDEDKIKELIKLAYDVMNELKVNVVQLKEVQPGRFRVQLRPEMLQNAPVEDKKSRKKE